MTHCATVVLLCFFSHGTVKANYIYREELISGDSVKGFDTEILNFTFRVRPCFI